MKRVRFRWAWGILAAAAGLYTGSLAFSALIPVSKIGRHSALWPVDATNLALLAFAVVGTVIVLRRPENRIGWIFLVMGATWQGFAFTNAAVLYGLLVRGWQSAPNAWLWLPGVMWAAAFALSPLLLLLFPTGRLISPRWRWAVWLNVAVIVLSVLTDSALLEAGQFSYDIPSLLQQTGLGGLVDPLQNGMALMILVLFLAGIAAMVTRLRRATGEERLQIKWFSYAAILYALTVVAEQILFFSPVGALDPSRPQVPADMLWGIPAALAFMGIPLAAAVAILRYRLYEIDLIIRRTLIYATLTLLLGLVYFGSVLVLEQALRALTGERQPQAVIVVSTLAISALASPLYRRVQAMIDRRFFRRKYDAEVVLAGFSAAARSEVALDQICARLLSAADETMQPEAVSLWLREHKETAP